MARTCPSIVYNTMLGLVQTRTLTQHAQITIRRFAHLTDTINNIVCRVFRNTNTTVGFVSPPFFPLGSENITLNVG